MKLALQLTIQTRPWIAPHAEAVLDRLCEHYGRYQRKLYARVAKGGGKAKDYKTEFCRAHGLTARYFNGLFNDVQGTIDGVRELLSEDIKDKRAGIKKLKSRLARFKKRFDEIQSKKLVVTTKVFKRWTKQQRKIELKIEHFEERIAEFKARLAANVPSICFGARKLFNKQFHLAENGYASHEAWKKDWQAARNHQCFFLGSGDEKGGNQSCTLFIGEDGLLGLRIRLPDAVVTAGRPEILGPQPKPSGSERYLVLNGLTFPYDEADLRRALRDGRALSWLIHKAHKGYRLMVSFDRPQTEVSTLSRKFGVIGIDFNADHLAIAETDPGGNIVKAWRVALPVEGKSSGQRNAILSDALEEVVEYALTMRKPIAGEDLDFTDKKKDMTAMTPAQACALSGLAYAKYQQLLASKCHRRGVELTKVDPAFTSVGGLIKYARPLGVSIHQAAAGVIARRSQGCKENLPKQVSATVSVKGVTAVFRLPVRNRSEAGGTTWKAIHKALGKFRREMIAARRTSVARKVGTSRGAMPRGPSGGTVNPAGIKSKGPP